MNTKEINLGIAAEEFQKLNVDKPQSKRLIKGIKSGRIAVLPGEIIETTSRYGE